MVDCELYFVFGDLKGSSPTNSSAVQRNNVFTGTTLDAVAVGTLTSVPYSYTADPASSVASIVQASAGTGKVTGL